MRAFKITRAFKSTKAFKLQRAFNLRSFQAYGSRTASPNLSSWWMNIKDVSRRGWMRNWNYQTVQSLKTWKRCEQVPTQKRERKEDRKKRFCIQKIANQHWSIKKASKTFNNKKIDCDRKIKTFVSVSNACLMSLMARGVQKVPTKVFANSCSNLQGKSSKQSMDAPNRQHRIP